MKGKCIILIIALSIGLVVNAQSVFNNVYNDYSRIYQNRFYNNEYFQDILILPNNEVLITGATNSLSILGDSIYSFTYAVKIDIDGDTIRTHRFSENKYTDNGGLEAILMPDSNIYLFGFTSPNLYEEPIYRIKAKILKLDKNLNLHWSKNYFDLDTISTIQKAIYDIKDNVFYALLIVSNDTNPGPKLNPLISKIDTSGILLNTWQISGIETDVCYDFKYLEDGTFLLSGLTYNNAVGTLGRPDIYILRVDTLGNVLWNRKIGYPGVDESRGRQALLLDDNSIYLVGRHEKMDGNNVGWLLKLNLSGDTIWTKMYDRGPQFESFYGIEKSNDGHLILLGSTRDYSFEPDIKPTPWLLKMDTNGMVIWDRLICKYADDVNADTYPFDFELAPDGGILLAGYVINNFIETDSIFHRNDAWLAKTDSCGYTVGDKPQALFVIDSILNNTVFLSNLSENYCSAVLDFGNGQQEQVYAYSAWTTGKDPNQFQYTFPNEGNYTITLTALGGENVDSYSVELSLPDYWTDSSQLYGSNGLVLYPNPVRNTLTIAHPFEAFHTFEIFNAGGKQILFFAANHPRIQHINLSHLSNGIYFLKASSKMNTSVTEKFVINK